MHERFATPYCAKVYPQWNVDIVAVCRVGVGASLERQATAPDATSIGTDKRPYVQKHAPAPVVGPGSNPRIGVPKTSRAQAASS
jgi:hypothetical protein